MASLSLCVTVFSYSKGSDPGILSPADIRLQIEGHLDTKPKKPGAKSAKAPKGNPPKQVAETKQPRPAV